MLARLLLCLLLLAPGLARAGAFDSTAPITPDGVSLSAVGGKLSTGLLPVQVVGTRTGSAALGWATASLQRYNQRMAHFFPYGANTIQLLLPGWTQGNGAVSNNRGEYPIPNSVFYLKGIKAITAGGTNYTAGDILVMKSWGFGLQPALVQVDTVAGGVITTAHVLRKGVYFTPLTDNTAQAAIWQNGGGFGVYGEPLFSGSNLSSYTLAADAGGFNFIAGNTTITIDGGSCTGGTISANLDGLTGAVNGIPPAGTWTCSDTTHGNPVAEISTGLAGTLGSGAQFTFDWGGAAYAVKISVDPTYTNESCTGNITGLCEHVGVTAGEPDPLGGGSFILVPSGTDVLTDPIAVNIPVGGTAGIRVFAYGSYPRGRVPALAGEAGTTDFATGDRTMSGTYGTTYPAATTFGFQPLAILGIPKVAGPSLLVVGDSREAGITGLGDATGYDVFDLTNGSVGWIERAVHGTLPMVNMSRSGDALYTMMRNGRMRLHAMGTIAKAGKFPALCYQGMNVNDFKGGAQSFATVQPWEIKVVSWMRANGCKFVFTDTTDPWAASSSTTFTIPWVAISTAGTGYGANTTFTATLAGGTGTAATVSITTDAAGIPRQINSITAPGSYTVAPSSPNTVTGGAGSGLQLTVYTSNFNTNQTADATANPNIQLRNTQLRSANFGTYAGVYDGVIDNAGITETVAGSGIWVSNCTKDGVHTPPNCAIQKGANADPSIAQWAATAAGMK